MDNSLDVENPAFHAASVPTTFNFRLTGLQLFSLAMAWAVSPLIVVVSFLAFDSMTAKPPQVQAVVPTGSASAGASAASTTKVAIPLAKLAGPASWTAADPDASKRDLKRLGESGGTPSPKSDFMRMAGTAAAKADLLGPARATPYLPQDGTGMSISDIVYGTAAANSGMSDKTAVATIEPASNPNSVLSGSIPQ